MKCPQISVVVPVYNVEKYLHRCVDSILSQTFVDFELILVDDGSTDKSGFICDEYAKKDGRIKTIHKENGGLSSARNAGIENSSGIYVCFVDSDDWVSNIYLEYLYSIIKKYDADIVSADYVITNAEKVDFFSESKEKVIFGTENILKFYLEQDKINGKNDFPAWIKLYKKSLFDSVKFPVGKFYEDNITNFKILNESVKYVKSSRIIYAYFQRQKSITKSKLSRKHLDLIDSSKEMLEIVEKKYSANLKLKKLCKRKIAMSYFSILAMYVRYGTDLSESKIFEILAEYKKIKSFYLRSELSLKIHLISLFMCCNIKLFRKLFVILSKNYGGGVQL